MNMIRYLPIVFILFITVIFFRIPLLTIYILLQVYFLVVLATSYSLIFSREKQYRVIRTKCFLALVIQSLIIVGIFKELIFSSIWGGEIPLFVPQVAFNEKYLEPASISVMFYVINILLLKKSLIPSISVIRRFYKANTPARKMKIDAQVESSMLSDNEAEIQKLQIVKDQKYLNVLYKSNFVQLYMLIAAVSVFSFLVLYGLFHALFIMESCDIQWIIRFIQNITFYALLFNGLTMVITTLAIMMTNRICRNLC